jgi:adenylyltransferase/sulfurtransferase
MMENEARFMRYARQTAFKAIGPAGQARLATARVTVMGVGALGTVIANALCRSGVGFIRLVDRDYVEISNLQRQTLYTEADAAEGLPKAVAACRRLEAVNSDVQLEPVVADIQATNVEGLIDDVDVVLDGSDNFELRFLINDACVKRRIPWVYGGALMDHGVSMNILPGNGPCLRCLVRNPPPPGSQPTCASAGVINMITGIVGCIEAAEAVKIILDLADVRRSFLAISLWKASFHESVVPRDQDCPACGAGRFEFLDNPAAVSGSGYAMQLCGRDEVQVTPPGRHVLDLQAIATRLAGFGTVKVGDFMLVLSTAERDIRLFRDGRAIISKVRDGNAARSVYAEYIGL